MAPIIELLAEGDTNVFLALLSVCLLTSPICLLIAALKRGHAPWWLLVVSLLTPAAAALWYHGLVRVYMIGAILVVVLAIVGRELSWKRGPVLAMVGLAMSGIPAAITFMIVLPYILGGPSN